MKKPITIFHIGYPKTASTWFQNHFYNKIGSHIYIDRNIIFDQLNKKNINYGEIQNNVPADKSCIICDERLCGDFQSLWINGFYADKVAERLFNINHDARIVIFIRNQIDIIASSYLQYVKGGGNYSVKKFLFHNDNFFKAQKMQLFSFDFFDYNFMIETYCKYFPKKNIHVFAYEDFNKNPIKFLEKFCNELSVTMPDDVQISPQNPRHNSRFTVQINRLLNYFTAGRMVNKRYLFDIPNIRPFIFEVIYQLNKFFPNRKVDSEKILTPKITEYIKEYYKESNKQLIDKFGLEQIKKYDYPL